MKVKFSLSDDQMNAICKQLMVNRGESSLLLSQLLFAYMQFFALLIGLVISLMMQPDDPVLFTAYAYLLFNVCFLIFRIRKWLLRIVMRQYLAKFRAKVFKYSPQFDSVEIEMDASRLKIDKPNESTEFSWSAFGSVEETNDFLYLLPNRFVVIPKNAFASKQEYEDCLALVKSHTARKPPPLPVRSN